LYSVFERRRLARRYAGNRPRLNTVGVELCFGMI
jgi:hypothetical protein